MDFETTDSFNWEWEYKYQNNQRVYKLLNTDKWVTREELRGFEIVDGVRVELPAPKTRQRRGTPKNGLLEKCKFKCHALRPSYVISDITRLEAFFRKKDISYTIEGEGEEKRLIGTKELFKPHDITYKKPARKVTVEITRTAPKQPEIIPPTPIKPIAAPTVTPTPRLIAPIAPTAINKLARPRCLGSYHYSFEDGRGRLVSYSSKVSP